MTRTTENPPSAAQKPSGRHGAPVRPCARRRCSNFDPDAQTYCSPLCERRATQAEATKTYTEAKFTEDERKAFQRSRQILHRAGLTLPHLKVQFLQAGLAPEPLTVEAAWARFEELTLHAAEGPDPDLRPPVLQFLVGTLPLAGHSPDARYLADCGRHLLIDLGGPREAVLSLDRQFDALTQRFLWTNEPRMAFWCKTSQSNNRRIVYDCAGAKVLFAEAEEIRQQHCRDEKLPALLVWHQCVMLAARNLMPAGEPEAADIATVCNLCEQIADMGPESLVHLVRFETERLIAEWLVAMWEKFRLPGSLDLAETHSAQSRVHLSLLEPAWINEQRALKGEIDLWRYTDKLKARELFWEAFVPITAQYNVGYHTVEAKRIMGVGIDTVANFTADIPALRSVEAVGIMYGHLI